MKLKIPNKVNFYYGVAVVLLLAINYLPPQIEKKLLLYDGLLKGLAAAPWVALPVLGFLGWRLNQTRILFSSLAMLGVFYLLQGSDRGILGMQGSDLAMGTSISLPLGLAFIFSFGEAPLFSQRSLLRLALLSLPVILLSGLALVNHADFLRMAQWEAFQTDLFHVPHAALLALLLFAVMSLMIRDPKIRPFMQALAFSLVPVLLAMDNALSVSSPQHHYLTMVLSFLLSSGILLWAIFSMYWHRVYIDELTGIPNRRALDEKFLVLESDYVLVMVDIDHFKKFNDSYGHDEGDNVLRYVARHLSDGSGGRAYRYGGEEFCLVFEHWAGTDAFKHADSIRETLSKHPFSIRLPHSIRRKTSAQDRGTLTVKSANVSVTISMGLALPDRSHPDPQSVIKLADQGLYEAKEKGRNRVIIKS